MASALNPKMSTILFTETNGQSLVYSFFTRYINTISVANQQPPPDNRPEVFSLPINDKPPSYNSLFKPSTSIRIQSNSLAAANRTISNQSLTSSVYSSYQTATDLATSHRSAAISNPAFVVDVNDLPSYDQSVRKIGSYDSMKWHNLIGLERV